MSEKEAMCTYNGALDGCHDYNCPVHGSKGQGLMNPKVTAAFERVVEACEEAFVEACKGGSWTERLVAAGLQSIAVDALEDIKRNAMNRATPEAAKPDRKVVPSANYA